MMNGIVIIAIKPNSPLLAEIWLEENSKPFPNISLLRGWDPSMALRIGGKAYFLSSDTSMSLFEFQITQQDDHCIIIGKIRSGKILRYWVDCVIVFVNVILIGLTSGSGGINIIVPILSIIISFFIKDFFDNYNDRHFERRIRHFFNPITISDDAKN